MENILYVRAYFFKDCMLLLHMLALETHCMRTMQQSVNAIYDTLRMKKKCTSKRIITTKKNNIMNNEGEAEWKKMICYTLRKKASR